MRPDPDPYYKWIFAVGSLLAAVFCFFPHLGGLVAAWQTEEYSHGILIPFIAALIGWHKLVEMRPQPSHSWAGLLLIFAGFAFLVISQLSAFEPPSHYGFVVCIAGIALSFFGWNTFKVLIPSFIYLFFAIPLPHLIEVALTAKMQLISTTVGVAVLQVFGVPVFQDGNIIDLGTQKLQVVEACSGLRYLFPLLSFGFLVAFMFNGAMWKRVVIFLSTVPLTLGMNALRIALVGVLVNTWGSGMADGFIHIFEGWVIFALCVAVLVAETWALSRIGNDSSKGHLRVDYIGLPRGPVFGGEFHLHPAGKWGMILCLFFALTLTVADFNDREEIIPARDNFTSFPLDIGEWRGVPGSMDGEVLEILRASDYWIADYRRNYDENSVNLYVAYYESQRIGVAAHSPANCIPGSGWQVVSREIIPLDLDGMSLPVTRMLIRKDKVSVLVYYWFDQRGRIINGQYGAKWYLFVDSMLKHRTDGAVIRLTTTLSDHEDESAGDAKLRGFLHDLHPVIHSYIPE